MPQASGTTMGEPTFPAGQVGEAVVQMASLPLPTNIPHMTIMATGMPFVTATCGRRAIKPGWQVPLDDALVR